MKSLVIYDSAYGNTWMVAEAIAGSIGASIRPVKQATVADVAGADLLIMGSPTQGGRPTPAILDFMYGLPEDVLKNKAAAAFDTRFAVNDHGFGLKLLMKTIGFAAPKISHDLKVAGCKIVMLPEGFIVNDKAGPLQRYELSRAADWAQEVYRAALPVGEQIALAHII